MVNYLMGRYRVGNRQACRCVRLHRSMYYYRTRMDPLPALRQRVRELAHARVRFGYRRIYILLRREGWDVGKSRFYRVYCEENLGLRRKRPWRHVSAVHRVQKQPAQKPNEVWGMDFVADQLADGRKIRTLTIIDLFTRECLGIEVGFSLRAEHVVAAMDWLKYDRAAYRNGSPAIMARSSRAAKWICGPTLIRFKWTLTAAASQRTTQQWSLSTESSARSV